MSKNELNTLETICRSIQAKSKRPRYPLDVRRRLVGLVERGQSVKSLQQATGVSFAALNRWVANARSRNELPKKSSVRILPVQSQGLQRKEQYPLLALSVDSMEIRIYAKEKA